MLKIYHNILIHHKKSLLFLLGFNRKIDRGGLFTYFQYIKGDIARFYRLGGGLK